MASNIMATPLILTVLAVKATFFLIQIHSSISISNLMYSPVTTCISFESLIVDKGHFTDSENGAVNRAFAVRNAG
jgi:hypothetical protein